MRATQAPLMKLHPQLSLVFKGDCEAAFAIETETINAAQTRAKAFFIVLFLKLPENDRTRLPIPFG